LSAPVRVAITIGGLPPPTPTPTSTPTPTPTPPGPTPTPTPTPIVGQVAVPTLDARGLIALTLILAAIGALAIRRMSS
jgi:hypothetical protein